MKVVCPTYGPRLAPGDISGTVEIHISEIIWTATLPDMQEIRIIGYLYENRLHWQAEFRPLLFTVCTGV